MAKQASPIIKVVFDTNILFSGSEAELVNQDTKALIEEFSDVADLRVEWFVPEVVVEERRFQMYRRAFELLPPIRKMEKLLGHNLNITEEVAKERVDAAITRQLQSLNLSSIPCDHQKVDWKDVISRACFRRPPFEDNDKEKGFRDAVIAQSFIQLVEDSPSTASVCRIVLLSSDVRLGEYIAEKLVHRQNARVLGDIEELKGLVNTLASEVEEELIDAVRPKCSTLFFAKDSKEGLFFTGKVRESIDSRFADKLNQIPESATSRSNGTWYISSPRFVLKKGQRITWKSRIDIVSKGMKEEESDPIHGLLSSSIGVKDPSPSLSILGLSDISARKRTVVHSGRTVFDITWSVQITTNKKLRLPKIESIEFVEVDWKNPIKEA